MKKIFNRHFSIIIYFFSLFIFAYLLFSARQCGLLPFPVRGTDQLTMLTAAADMYRGQMPPVRYLYSPIYTLFLYVLVVLSQGDLIEMRLLQAALCALSPVLIYKLARRIRIDRESSQIAALLYCFYGASALVSLSFLRAGPLAFCYILYTYVLVNAFIKRRKSYYVYAGITAALCVLGRENFIPVVVAPVVLIVFKDIRRNTRKSFICAYFLATFCAILPFSLYNYLRFQSFAIIPGALENIFTVFYAEKSCRVVWDVALFNSIILNVPVQFYRFISSYEIPNSLSFYAHKEIIDFMVIFFIPFNLLLGFAIAGVYFFRKNKGVLFIALSITAFCASMLFFNMFYRYRVPVVPLVSLLAGVGVTTVFRLRPVHKMILPLVFVLLFFFLTYTHPDSLRRESERTSVARILILNKQYAKAEDYIKNLDEESVNTDQLYSFLIAALNEDGETAMAKSIMINKIKQKQMRGK